MDSVKLPKAYSGLLMSDAVYRVLSALRQAAHSGLKACQYPCAVLPSFERGAAFEGGQDLPRLASIDWTDFNKQNARNFGAVRLEW